MNTRKSVNDELCDMKNSKFSVGMIFACKFDLTFNWLQRALDQPHHSNELTFYF